MPTERFSVRRMRDLLHLKYAQGLSDRAVARSLGLGKGTVGNYLAQARQAGFSWPLATDLDDDSLQPLLFPRPTMASRLDRPVPDWSVMDVELRRSRVTRALLWEEYRAANVSRLRQSLMQGVPLMGQWPKGGHCRSILDGRAKEPEGETCRRGPPIDRFSGKRGGIDRVHTAPVRLGGTTSH